jgi:arylsulfatase A-like enzyme
MKTNLVFIITDNQSPWTLGCYGNREILTPNIDRLAAGGARFTNAFCVNPVCSPNRATLLTGLLPSQHGVHNWLGSERPDAQMGDRAYCTIGEFNTLPRMMAEAGYDCGLSGKWHLGDSLHPQLGFNYWFTQPKGHITGFYDNEAVWNGQVYRERRYCLEAITDHALDFLRRRRSGPFLLYVGYNAPYGLDQDMRVGHRNRHTGYYADKKLDCFPREAAHPWLVMNRDCIRNETAMRSYACAVSGVDDGVGAILNALAELGIEKETLVVYTADHGLCAGHHGMWGMGDHSRPLHMFQENLRVPLIFRQPGAIPPGRAFDRLVCHYDFFPSVVPCLQLPQSRDPAGALPGRSYADILAGRPAEPDGNDAMVFHEYENTRAVQTPQWKLVRRHPDGPNELYDLGNDAGERRNLFGEPRHAGIQARLTGALHTFFEQYADPQYDLWRNGRSKAGRILEIDCR